MGRAANDPGRSSHVSPVRPEERAGRSGAARGGQPRAMDGRASWRSPDPELFEAALGALEQQPGSALELLGRRFPGRAGEIEAVLPRALKYLRGLEDVRRAHGTAAGAAPVGAGALLGDFEIVGLLGAGNMGRVYRARQRSLGGREVALKVLAPELVARDPRFVERFRREATLAAGVHHPSLAEVYGSGESEGQLYFAMRLVEGRTLRDVLADLAGERSDDGGGARGGGGGVEHVRRAVLLVREVAAALAAIHARGLVHRDVKPSNIVLDRRSGPAPAVAADGPAAAAERRRAHGRGAPQNQVGAHGQAGGAERRETHGRGGPRERIAADGAAAAAAGRLEDPREDPREGAQAALGLRPVLVDFGLLRPVEGSDLTGSRTLLGTPAYASPEARLGHAVDARADVFSLGAVLYDLLDPAAMGTRAAAAAGLQDLRAVEPALDERLAAILAMALDERAALRYADGAALRDELDRYLAGQPLRALPASPLARARLWARREPLRAARRAALAAALALPVLLSAAWLGQRVARLYGGAAEGARLERAGDLLGARAAYRVLYEDRAVAARLPGLGDDVARSRGYHGELGDALERLASAPESEWKYAHVQLLRAILTPGRDDWDAAVLRFLAREIGSEAAGHGARRPLAAESAAHYLLVHPRRLVRSGEDGELDRALDGLEAALLSAVLPTPPSSSPAAGAAGDVVLRRMAVSALSGMTGAGVFETLIRPIGDDDAELRRLAVAGTDRMWRQMREEGELALLSDDCLARWAATVHASGMEHGVGRSQVCGGLFERALQEVAWTRLEREGAADARPYSGLPRELESYLREVEQAFGAYVRGPAAPPLPYLFRAGPLSDPDPAVRRSRFESGWRPDQSPCHYENLFGGEAAGARGEAREPRALPGPTAGLSFTPEGAILSGAAAGASWEGAMPDEDGSEAYLSFESVGAPGLRLSVLVPPEHAGADVTLHHCKASRVFLPDAGRAWVRISLADGQPLYECAATLSATDLSFHLDAHHLTGRTQLELTIQLAAGTTTYRLYWVEVRFQPM